MFINNGQNRDTQTVACTLYRFYLKIKAPFAFGGRAPPGLEKRYKFEPPIAKLYVPAYSNKKAVLSQGNRAIAQLFCSV